MSFYNSGGGEILNRDTTLSFSHDGLVVSQNNCQIEWQTDTAIYCHIPNKGKDLKG